ncbi:MAG: hypothetical protein FWC67_03560 [Defluviitaleaceae bacterium]|nr:hypothetical protein [Defluviitaleaceae bacterium]
MSEAEQWAILAVAVLFVLPLVLRIILTSSFQAATALLSRKREPLMVRGDIDKLGGVLGRAARDYVALAGRGSKVDSLELAKMTVSKNRLLFFNFNSISGLVMGLETAFLPLAILFGLAASAQVNFAIFCGIIFIIMRILIAIFDVQTIKERYISTLAHTLSRDIGKFFPDDNAAAVHAFSVDLKDYLTRQSAMYGDILIKINSEFVTAIKTSTTAMTANMEATLNSMARHESLDVAIKEIKALGAAAAAITASLGVAGQSAALEDSLEATKASQAALATSVAHYETSLKDITSQMGDALGKIVSFHLSSANSAIAESIEKNLKDTRAAYAEQISEIKAVFAELNKQNQYQTRILMELARGAGDDEQ